MLLLISTGQVLVPVAELLTTGRMLEASGPVENLLASGGIDEASEPEL